MFTSIKPEKAEEWRLQFGGDAASRAKEEAAKIASEKKNAKKKGKESNKEGKEKVPELTKEEEAAKKAAKKAAKAAKKEKGRLGKQPAEEGKGVESAEKDGVEAEGVSEVQQVTEGVKNAVLQSS